MIAPSNMLHGSISPICGAHLYSLSKNRLLHKIVTTIEDLINVKIDLKKASHRVFVNNFIMMNAEDC